MSSLLHPLALACLLFAPPDPVIEPVDIALPVVPTPNFERRTFEGDPIGVQQIVLANGLTVILSENHERPDVFGAVVVRAGSKDDPADNTGMAHYLEHLMFKGTQTLGTTNWAAEAPLQAELVELYERHKRADSDEERAELQTEIAKVVEQTYAYVIPNELRRMLSALGATDEGAFTREDETVYHSRFPASEIEPWLRIAAHRFVDPVFRLFPTELEVVYEEKNQSLDDFEWKLYEEIMAHAFPQHPYGTQSPLGQVEHLKSPSLLAMQEFFDEYYVPNNMVLVLVGDFDSETILPIIAEQFGAWQRGPEPEPRTGPVEPFEGRERVKLRSTPFRMGAHVFRAPTARHPDYAALQIARELLFNEHKSGFINELEDRGKLLGAHWATQDFADHGLDIVLFAPRILGQTFKNAEHQVREQYQRVARGEFDEQKVVEIRDGILRAEELEWETNKQRALLLIDGLVRYDGWQGYLDYREHLAHVTREDVMRVAATYYGDDYLDVRSRVGWAKKPRLSKPSYPAVAPQPNVHSSFYDEVMATPSAAPSLRLVDFGDDVSTTPIGENAVLRANHNPFNDSYSLSLVFGVGTERIRELFVAAPYLERLGTPTHSPTALHEQLSALGTTLTIAVDRDRLQIELRGPEQHLAATLELVEALLRDPVTDAKRWKALRRERVAIQRVDRQYPDSALEALVGFAAYGERSASLRDYGPRGARSLSAEMLLAAWQQAQAYGLEVRYIGQREPDEVAAILQRSLRGSLARSREPALPYTPWVRALPEHDTVYFLPRRGQVQTQMVFAVDGEPVAREQIAAAYAYSRYMSWLVFQEVLEFRALAYVAQGSFQRNPDPAQAGWFVGHIASQADKTFDTIDVMQGLIRDTPSKSDQMDELRAMLLHGLEAQSPGFRDLQAVVEYWRRLGYDEDPRTRMIEDYAELDFGDIQAFHAAQVAGRPVILMVVGDPRRVDVRALARYGEVIEVGERDVFAR